MSTIGFIHPPPATGGCSQRFTPRPGMSDAAPALAEWMSHPLAPKHALPVTGSTAVPPEVMGLIRTPIRVWEFPFHTVSIFSDIQRLPI